MSSENSKSNDDEDEEVVYRKVTRGISSDFSEDEEDINSIVSSDDEYDESRNITESARYGDEREIYEYDDEDQEFDYEDGSSSLDDLDQLEFEEEDEVMQCVVDEDRKARVAILDAKHTI